METIASELFIQNTTKTVHFTDPQMEFTMVTAIINQNTNQTLDRNSTVDRDLIYGGPGTFWGMVQTTVIVIFTVLIVVGNVSNIVIISRSIKSYGVTGYFMISLAFADLGVGIIVTPLSIGASIYRSFTDLYSWGWCEFTGLIVAALCAISIYSIALLTVDKYVYIVHPMRYNDLLKPWKCVIMIGVMWVVCCGYFIVHRFWFDTYYYDAKSYICTIDFPREWRFTLFVIFTIVLPPAGIIIYCNYMVFKIAHGHALQIQAVMKSVAPHADRDLFPAQQWKALKMNILIAGAFFVAWVPYSIVQVILGLSDADIPQPVIFIIQWVALGNSFWNSIIYFHLNAVYRSKATRMWRWLLCRGKQIIQGSATRSSDLATSQTIHRPELSV